MLAKNLQGAAAAAVPAYVEDVFSTFLYTGSGAGSRNNGIDFSGKGGLLWVKARDQAYANVLYDTARGATKQLISNATSAETTVANGITSFTSTGFSTGSFNNEVSAGGVTYASWSFREQAKFFDVVTYTGNGSNRTIAHNLGSVPGCIIVKRTDTTADWQVYHRSLANTEYIVLNSTAAKATGTTRWNSTTPTSTVFSLGTDATVNANGGTYVAYIFAHDAGGFGASGSDNVISCGSFTTDGSGNATVSLGYEPQWFLRKETSGTNDWVIFDNMRGWSLSDDAFLYPNRSSAEASADRGNPTATGFTLTGQTASATFIYIAIRRGPMKTPTSGTSVFSLNTYTGTDSSNLALNSNIVSDAYIVKRRTGSTSGWKWMERLISYPDIGSFSNPTALDSTSTAAESNSATWSFSRNKNYNYDYFEVAQDGAGNWSVSGSTYTNYAIKRAPGFFDVVCYTGTGSATTQAHNLGIAPELIIVKARDRTGSNVTGFRTWAAPVAATYGPSFILTVNETSPAQQSSIQFTTTAPTSSVFSIGTATATNASGSNYVAYLFATVSGVSKVGSYTGNGSNQTINCGFTGGARFILIKRTDDTGDWYVWDSARGIVAGDDPYLLLNSTAVEVTNTDYVDTFAAGFEISSTAPAAINANGGTFIFLAIA
jgi:hypothetical protein